MWLRNICSLTISCEVGCGFWFHIETVSECMHLYASVALVTTEVPNEQNMTIIGTTVTDPVRVKWVPIVNRDGYQPHQKQQISHRGRTIPLR